MLHHKLIHMHHELIRTYKYERSLICTSQTHSYASRTHTYVTNMKEVLCMVSLAKKYLRLFGEKKNMDRFRCVLQAKETQKVSRHSGLFCNIWVSFATFETLLQHLGLFGTFRVSLTTFGSLLQRLGLCCNMFSTFDVSYKRDPKVKSPFGSLLQRLGLFCNIGSLLQLLGFFCIIETLLGLIFAHKRDPKGTSKETQQVSHQLVLVHVGNMLFGSLLRHFGFFCSIETLLGLICKTKDTQ